MQNFYSNRYVERLMDSDRKVVEFKLINLFNTIQKRLTKHVIDVSVDITYAYHEDEVIKALCEEKILHISKFHSYIRTADPDYLICMQDYASSLFSKLTLKNKFKYVIWRRYNSYYLKGESKFILWKDFYTGFIEKRTKVFGGFEEPKKRFIYELGPYKPEYSLKYVAGEVRSKNAFLSRRAIWQTEEPHLDKQYK